MSIKGIFSAREYTVPLDVTLLVIRVVTGIAFMLHGWGKIQAPMSWMGPDAPVPGVFQFLAAFSEFGGGIAWALGFLFPLHHGRGHLFSSRRDGRPLCGERAGAGLV
jgi:putative oxidoreductase